MYPNLNILKAELAALKEQYIDCMSCPPEEKCCYFSPEFAITFRTEAAEQMFSSEVLEGLLSSRSAVKNSYGYRIFNGPCPALSDGLCSVHEKKHELGLEGCLDFPLYLTDIITRNGKQPLYGPFVIAEQRCFAMKDHWAEISQVLQDLSDTYFVPIKIREKGRLFTLP